MAFIEVEGISEKRAVQSCPSSINEARVYIDQRLAGVIADRDLENTEADELDDKVVFPRQAPEMLREQKVVLDRRLLKEKSMKSEAGTQIRLGVCELWIAE